MADVHQFRGFGLANRRYAVRRSYIFLFLFTVPEVGNPRGDHRPLALIQMPPMQVLGDHIGQRIASLIPRLGDWLDAERRAALQREPR
jgi:hypothetical protein